MVSSRRYLIVALSAFAETKRFGDQAGEGFLDLGFVEVLIRRNLLRGAECEFADKDRQSAEYSLFEVGNEVVAPVERCVQGLVPW